MITIKKLNEKKSKRFIMAYNNNVRCRNVMNNFLRLSVVCSDSNPVTLVHNLL